MKKISFYLASVMLGVFFIGCNNSNAKDVNSTVTKIDKTESISGVEEIRIESGASEINLYAYDGSEVKVKGELGDYSKGLEINKRGNTLYIKEESKKNIGVNIEHTKLDIMIPKTFNGNLDFNQGAGKADINNLDLKDINIDGGAGKLTLSNICFNNLDLDSGVGQVNIETGDRSGDIDINGGVGEVNVAIKKVGGDLIYDGGVGSSNIKIPKNSPISIKSESGLGSIENEAVISGNGDYIFDISVGVGSIRIYN